MSGVRMSDITVASLELADVDAIVRYWHESPAEYLRALGVAPEKLPNRRKMHEMLALKVAQQVAPPTILVVKVKGESIGVHELTHIEVGISAVMHAHIWKAEHRGKGFGAVSYVKAMERFFEAHGFRSILFETPRANASANRLKEALGLAPCGNGTIYLPIMTSPMETTRYSVERADLPRLVARLETSWKPKTGAPRGG
ncbi:GNAT family N-acetyltransferase [Pendulispora albinea]|uniref:GNAT family N-acetyltransferase n=1 Tax=Pendulispora albinea TaxID=2741071 RepID=A0ABZ2M104_9BACT